MTSFNNYNYTVLCIIMQPIIDLHNLNYKKPMIFILKPILTHLLPLKTALFVNISTYGKECPRVYTASMGRQFNLLKKGLKNVIIIGIDPGFAITGYGVVTYKGNKFQMLENGVINTPAQQAFPDRLLSISQGLEELIARFRPDAMAVEELFFNTNVKTAIKVGHGRGIALLSAAKAGIPVYEYTPLQVKQAVVGYGRANKEQVQQMVKVLLSLDKIPKPDDAADALAIAICHAHTGTGPGSRAYG